jgi:hypothetical protein
MAGLALSYVVTVASVSSRFCLYRLVMSRSNRACPVLINYTVRYQQVNGRVASAASMPGRAGYDIISTGPGWSRSVRDLVELNGWTSPQMQRP